MINRVVCKYAPEQYNGALECGSKVKCRMSIALGSGTFAKVTHDTCIVVGLTFQCVGGTYSLWYLRSYQDKITLSIAIEALS